MSDDIPQEEIDRLVTATGFAPDKIRRIERPHVLLFMRTSGDTPLDIVCARCLHTLAFHSYHSEMKHRCDAQVEAPAGHDGRIDIFFCGCRSFIEPPKGMS